MATDYEDYRSWYADLLPTLYHDRNAGFAILMVVFPLLERYLRQKNGLHARDTLSEHCMDDLARIFPVLSSRQSARNFWNVYRNGILHEVTLSRQTRSGSALPLGWLSHDISAPISVESNGNFWVHPVLFSKQILQTIENDFKIFEGTSGASTRLPTVKVQSETKTTDPATGQEIVLGTSTDP